jgi:hypothetical protein
VYGLPENVVGALRNHAHHQPGFLPATAAGAREQQDQCNPAHPKLFYCKCPNYPKSRLSSACWRPGSPAGELPARSSSPAAPGPHTRALFFFPHGRLLFDDPRQFGRIEVGDSLPERVTRLGPDALSISPEDFAGRLRGRRGILKPVLLNQTVLRGLGNIYTDEALFRARIHPRAMHDETLPEEGFTAQPGSAVSR